MSDEQPIAAEQQVAEQATNSELAPEPAQLGSIESWLQQRRTELAEQQSYEIPIPGFADRLVGVYHKPPYRELRQIGERNEKMKGPEWLRELYGACDTLILCCDDIYATDGEQRVSLGPWSIQTIGRFGVSGPEITSARIAMLQLYKGNELMLVKHSAELFEASNGEAEIEAEEDELAGNSEPASAGT